MKLSMATEPAFLRFGYKKGLEVLKQGGFDTLDFSFHKPGIGLEDIWSDDCDYKTIFADIRKTADELGITFNQAHAPFASRKEGDDEYTRITFNKIVRSIEMSGILGVKILIVHPYQYPGGENHMQENLEFYRKLIPYAKKANVKIATENVWGFDRKRGYIVRTALSYSEDLKEFIDLIDSEWITVCLDLGHVGNLGREAQDEIRALRGYIGALHVHDNDYAHDSHKLCYSGDMNWDEITKALGEIGYSGDFTYETLFNLAKVPDELMPVSISYMHTVAEYLAGKIEEAKKA